MATIKGSFTLDEYQVITSWIGSHRFVAETEVRLTRDRLRLTRLGERSYTVEEARSRDLEIDLEIAADHLATLVRSSEHSYA
jgi:hypothetical protein